MENDHKSRTELLAEIQYLRERLKTSEDIVQAIHQGEIDALVIDTAEGQKVFTLHSADLSYRILVEEMQQGAVILSTEGLILYSNKSFAKLLKQSLEKLIGSYFQALITPQDTPLFNALVKKARMGEKHPVEMFLTGCDGVEIPVYLSINHLCFEDAPINCIIITDLTEQKRNEKILKNQAQLIDLAHDAILTVDLNDIITFWNHGAEEMYGFSKAEALGKNLSILEQNNLPKPLIKIKNELFEHGHWEGETIQQKRDGTLMFIASRWTLQRDSNGQPVEIMKINTDITKHKEAEAARSYSSARLAGILDIAEDAIISVDETQKITLFNKGAEKIFGYSAAEVCGQSLNLLLPFRLASIHHQHITEFSKFPSVARKMGGRNEIFGRRKDGTEFSAEASISRLELNGEKIYTAILRDITERKQAEAELRELNLALENAVEGIARLDAQGYYISVNRAYAENCGYQVSKMVGMEWSSTVHPEDRPKISAAYQEMLTNSKVETEAKGLRKDGSIFYKQLVMISAYNKENEFVGHYCFMKDITDRKQAEVELAAAKEAAEAANRAKSEFLANMSHEIRTPMNAIIGFSELLEETITEPESLSYLNSIAASGKTLLALINDILDLSKIEAGKLQLQYESVNVRSVLQEIQQILNPKAVKKGLLLLVEIDENVPAAIMFDPIRLRQILFNAVGNAIKFTDAGFVKISLRTQTEISPLSSQVQMEITITDTGIGIGFDQQEIIFEAFKQSEGQSTRKYGGTGLGLAITKRLTEMLGGTVSLKSELGKGSNFIFIFPNLRITEIENQSVVSAKLDEDFNQFQPVTVLVVDDVKYNLDLIAGYFAGSKHHLLFAEDGQSAIEIAQTYSIDLILMDLWMPNMDGLQAIKLLKQDEKTKNIPIVIVTAISSSEDEDNVRSLTQGFLRKPFNRSQLISALKLILPQEASYLAVDEKSITANQIEHFQLNSNALVKFPELVEKLREEEESTWLELRKTMKKRDIQAFIERLRDWVQEYQCQLLFDYMKTLESQLAAFDWEQLPKTIEKFTEIKEQLL